MINCQSFKTFESILLLTLTISIQQYRKDSTGFPSPAEEAKKELENILQLKFIIQVLILAM